jgi:hypothetical protein
MTDLRSDMEVIVKHSSLSAHAAGFALKTKAMATRNPKHFAHLTRLSIAKFERALQVNTNNVVTLRNMAEMVFFGTKFAHVTPSCMVFPGIQKQGITFYV